MGSSLVGSGQPYAPVLFGKEVGLRPRLGQVPGCPRLRPRRRSAVEPDRLDVGGGLTLKRRNPASVSSDLKFTNASGGPVDVWTDKVQEFATPTAENYELVANGDSASLALSGPAVLSGKALLSFTIASASRLSLVEARLVFRDGGCRFPLLITELRG